VETLQLQIPISATIENRMGLEDQLTTTNTKLVSFQETHATLQR